MEPETVDACDHIGLFTNNADRLAEFYTAQLGFTMQKDETLPAKLTRTIFGVARECRFIRLASEGKMLEIFEPRKGGLDRRKGGIVGINHFGLRVSDREALVKKLRRGKAKVIEFRRNGRSGYFAVDPDGNRIEIRE